MTPRRRSISPQPALWLSPIALFGFVRAGRAASDALAGEARLEKHVTASLPLETLKRALDSISQQCGVPLTVDSRLEKETV